MSESVSINEEPFFDDIELNDIFIGRQEQLYKFRLYLHSWMRQIADESVTTTTAPVKAAPSPNDQIQGLVVLLYGRGGFGKSTLLKQYRNIASELSYDLQLSAIVDWEFMNQDDRVLFNVAVGEKIDENHYYHLLHEKLALALERSPGDFKEYLAAVKAVQEAQQQARNELNALQRKDHPWLSTITSEALLAVLRTVALPVPGATSFLNNEAVAKAIKDVAGEGVTVGVEQIRQVWVRLQDRLGERLGNFLDASLHLGQGLGRDLAQWSKKSPLLIFFDTYEEIDEGDHLLRICMGAAGRRAGWIISGRDNLWAGLGLRRRSVEIEHGYKELVLPDRRLEIDFSAEGVGGFTLSDVQEYFEQLREKMRGQLPSLTEKESAHILDVTRGVPLAVKIVASLYLERLDINVIIEGVDEKREVVDQMVQRYLVHTRTIPSDRAKIYGLALLRRAEDPAMVAIALGINEGYEIELSRLQRRYGFIFTPHAQPSLHQEVRHFLRLWLLERRTSPEISLLCQRLRDAYLLTFQKLEEERRFSNLQARLEDEQWVGLYLDLCEQQFWLDPAQGMLYLLPFMCAASIYYREINREAAQIGTFFQGVLWQPYRKYWEWVAQCLIYKSSRKPLRDEFSALKDIARYAQRQKIAFPALLPDFSDELEGAIWWRLAEAYREKNTHEALVWYKKAANRLPDNQELLMEQVDVTWEAEHAPHEQAVEMDDETDHGNDGVHGSANQTDQQIANLRQILEHNPKSADAYAQRAQVYMQQHEYRHAITDLDSALELEPDSAQLYMLRGDAFVALGELHNAIRDFDSAVSKNAEDISIYLKRGKAYFKLKDVNRALEDFERVLTRDPENKEAVEKKDEALRLVEQQQKSIKPWKRARIAPHTSVFSAEGCMGLVVILLLIFGLPWMIIRPWFYFTEMPSLQVAHPFTDTFQDNRWRWTEGIPLSSTNFFLDMYTGRGSNGMISHISKGRYVVQTVDSLEKVHFPRPNNAGSLPDAYTLTVQIQQDKGSIDLYYGLGFDLEYNGDSNNPYNDQVDGGYSFAVNSEGYYTFQNYIFSGSSGSGNTSIDTYTSQPLDAGTAAFIKKGLHQMNTLQVSVSAGKDKKGTTFSHTVLLKINGQVVGKPHTLDSGGSGDMSLMLMGPNTTFTITRFQLSTP